MSKVNAIQRLDPRVSYVGAAWSNTGSAVQDPAAGGVTPATNAIAGRGQFGTGSQPLDGHNIAKGTGGGVTPMVPTIDFTYDRRLDSTEGSGVDVYDTASVGNLSSGTYFRIVENGSNIRNMLYPRSPGVPSYGLQIIAKDLSTEISPIETQCYVDPVLGKFVLPRPVYWSKCESVANVLTSAEIGSATATDSNFDVTSTSTMAKFNNAIYQYSTGNLGHRTVFSIDNCILNAGTISFWGMNSGYHKIYLDVATNTYVKLHTSSSIYINGEEVATQSGVATALKHIYIIWDSNQNITGGKSIVVFINGVEVLSTTHDLTTFTSDVLFGYYINNGTVSWDNIKIWQDVIADPSFEYNGGGGRELAMHAMYGSANNYIPVITGTNNGVCYNYLPLPADPVKLIKGSNITATLENASNVMDGSGSFGGTSSLYTSAFVQLYDGTHFQYDKKLDASVMQDPINGFGSTPGGIIDTGISGSLASGKYIRVVDNTKNIVDVTGLNLDVYAKHIINPKLVTPSSTQCYIDPTTGIFILPRPIFFDKCDVSPLTPSPQITSDLTPTYVPYESAYLDTPSWHLPTGGKFGGCYIADHAFDHYATNTLTISPFAIKTFPPRGVWSFWSSVEGGWRGRGNDTNGWAWFKLYLSPNTYIQAYSRSYTYEHFVYINNIQVYYLSVGTSGIFRHYMVAYDTSGGLQGGGYLKFYVNGALIYTHASAFPYQSEYPKIEIMGGCSDTGDYNAYSYTKLDNLKIWNEGTSDHLTDFLSMEYNAGAGIENALHYIYGPANNYAPKLVSPGGVGYFKSGSSGSYTKLTF